MTTERLLFDWFELAVVAGLLCLGAMRVLILRARGVRVVAIDRQRAAHEIACDLILGISLLLWVYLVIGRAWPLPSRWVPLVSGAPLVDSFAAKLSGASLALAGLVLYGLALSSLSTSWRIGIDRKTPGRLVTRGVFAWTRNPIYVAFDLVLAGVFLVQGRGVFLALALVVMALFHVVILREERFLEEEFGREYREYRARVGRYVTWRRAGGDG